MDFIAQYKKDVISLQKKYTEYILTTRRFIDNFGNLLVAISSTENIIHFRMYKGDGDSDGGVTSMSVRKGDLTVDQLCNMFRIPIESDQRYIKQILSFTGDVVE